MADAATLQTRLDEAEQARHALATGQRVVDVWRDGQRVRYQESNKGDLYAYIADLRNELAAATAPATGALPRRRAIPVAF